MSLVVPAMLLIWVSLLAALSRVRQLALRMPDKRLARNARILFWMLLIGLPTGVAFVVLWILLGPGGLMRCRRRLLEITSRASGREQRTPSEHLGNPDGEIR